MLMPKKVKYRKQQRGRMTGKAWRGSELAFGQFGLKVLDPAVSGQAGDEEAGRNPYGQRQGGAGSLGCGGAAGEDFVRDGRRFDHGRERSNASGVAQASAADDVRETRSAVKRGLGGKKSLL